MNEERINEIQGEINACKILLRDTDYSLNKLVENIANCNTFNEVKAACSEYLVKYGDIIEKRREWRRRINELEEELNS